MEGINIIIAIMEGVNIIIALMEGVNIVIAIMEGVNIIMLSLTALFHLSQLLLILHCYLIYI